MRRTTALAIAMIAMLASACTDDAVTSARTTTTAPTDCTPARAAEAGTTSATLPFGGVERSYELTVPAGYDGSNAAPLLFNLHGFSSNAKDQNAYTDMPAAAGERGYVVVAPDGGPLKIPIGFSPDADAAADFEGMPFWNFFSPGEVSFGPGRDLGLDSSTLGADDTAFIEVLLDRLERDLCIDSERVFSTGMSNGAGMSTTLGCEIGDRLAAIAPVAGVNLTAKCRGTEPVPVFAIHGEADTTAGFEGNLLMGFEMGNPSVAARMEQWADHNGCSGDPTVTKPAPKVALTAWAGCDAEVRLLTIAGLEHEWPGESVPQSAGVDATKEVLDFFDATP